VSYRLPQGIRSGHRRRPRAFMEGSHFRLRVASLARSPRSPAWPVGPNGSPSRRSNQRYGVPVTSASWAPNRSKALAIRSRVPSGCVRWITCKACSPLHWRQVVSQDRGRKLALRQRAPVVIAPRVEKGAGLQGGHLTIAHIQQPTPPQALPHAVMAGTYKGSSARCPGRHPSPPACPRDPEPRS